MRIILIEDHAGIRMALSLLLELEGHHPVAFDRGEDALDAICSDPQAYDLILLDLNTNGISAAEFIARLDGAVLEGGVVRPRIGILSGNVGVEEEARRLGADFVFSKPFHQEELMARVSKLAAGA